MANNSEFIINTTLNTNGVDAGANRVNTKMKNLGKSVEQTSNRMSQSMNRAFADNRVKTAPYEALEKRLAQITVKYDQLAEKEYRFLSTGGSEKSTTYRRMEYDLDKIEQEQDAIIAKMRQMEAAGTAYQSAPIRQVGVEAEGAARSLTSLDSAQRSSNSSAKKSKHIFSGLSKIFKKHNVSVGKTFKNVLKYAFGIRSLFVLFNRLRRGLIEGFNNLARFNNGINPTNTALSNLKSALTQLKNSFATAFSPILVTIEPILTGFINKISEAVTMLGMFFAKLTGAKTFTKAKKVQEQYAQATEESAKAQEKLNEKLADYDKLDVIQQDNKSNTGSSGSGGISPNDMFEEVALDDSAVDWAEKFKKAWETADFTEIGSIVGNKIKNALDNINWEDIKKGAEKVGKSTATFINGFVESGILQSLGKTVGESINTALTGANAFIVNTDWENLGSEISKAISEAFKTVDWKLVGKHLVDNVVAALDFVAGLINGIDWASLPGDIVNAIKDVLTGADWKKLFGSLGNLASSILKAIWEFDKACAEILGDVAKQIKDYFVKKIEDAGYDKDKSLMENGKAILTGILNGIIDAVKNIGSWIYDNIIEPFIDNFFDGNASSSLKKLGEDLWKKVSDGVKSLGDLAVKIKGKWEDTKEGLKKKWQSLTEGVKTKIYNISSAWTDTKQKIKDKWSSLMSNVKNKIASIGFKFPSLSDIRNGVKTMVNRITSFLNTYLIDNINKLFRVTVPDNVVTQFLGIAGVTRQIVRIPHIPRLATGAVIPPNQEFLAMLGDQKRGVNIETPLETMVQAFLTALDNRGGAGMPDKLEITLANGKTLAEVVWDESEKKYKQTGYMPRYI